MNKIGIGIGFATPLTGVIPFRAPASSEEILTHGKNSSLEIQNRRTHSKLSAITMTRSKRASIFASSAKFKSTSYLSAISLLILVCDKLFLTVSGQFLYVPQGKTEEDGVVLREIDQSSLPPGEYEVVAMFDNPPGSGSPGRASGSPFELPGISLETGSIPVQPKQPRKKINFLE